MKVGLVALLLLSSVPVNAHESRRAYTKEHSCYKETYREEYVAGTKRSQGYMKSFTDRVKIACSPMVKGHHHHYNHHIQRSIPTYVYSRTRYYQPKTTYRASRPNYASSSACRSSRATSGVLGGGLAAAVSKKDAWGWTIPLGTVIGLGVGDANC